MQDPEEKATILVVDDSKVIRTLLSSIIKKLGQHCMMASDGNGCIEIINTHQIDLLLLDLHMEGKNGIEVLSYLRDHHFTIPVIMISGSSDIEQAVESLKMGAYDFLIKPLNPDKLAITIKNVLAACRANNREAGRKKTLGFHFYAYISKEKPYQAHSTPKNPQLAALYT